MKRERLSLLFLAKDVAVVINDLNLLNEQQLEAVTMLEGATLVLAGAGSGKTRVVTYRIAYLIQNGISSSQILGLTFTNKAAGEMRERVHKLCDEQVVISTFHSLGMRVLRESIYALDYHRRFMIYDEEDVNKLIKLCLEELHVKSDQIDPKQLRQLISRAKNALQSPEVIENYTYAGEEIEEFFPPFYALYQQKLKEFQAVDFDDLLFLTVKLWKEHPEILEKYQKRWPFVLIDEYQDTNAAQYTLTKMLVSKSGNIFAVGDPDQSIYSWRGANVQNIMNFERDYPGAKVILLEQNYRSSTNILNAANALINHNSGRYEKALWSDLGEGNKIQLYVAEDDRQEAHFVASRIEHYLSEGISVNEMAVFYRTNAQSRIFEDYLIARGIPYKIIGGLSFYQRKEIKDILAYLRVVQSDADYISFARTINLPKRGLGDVTIEKMRHHATAEGLSVLAYCEALLSEKPLKTILRLTAKQRAGLAEYIQVIHELRQLDSLPLLVEGVIEKAGYKEYLKEDKETYQDRQENVDQLLAKAIEWEISAPEPTLESFLEELSLKSSLDEGTEQADKLSLMTIHNGKGLEFTLAFLVGLEETLFPHVNARNDEDAIEEERRLCYVGITRAKKYLYITHSHLRYLWGSCRAQRPSRFLKEIPLQFIEKYKKKTTNHSSSLTHYPSKERIHYTEKASIVENELFEVGDCVVHNEFGRGKVQESYEGSMGQTYKILFISDKRVKTIVAKYAVLQRE